MNITATKKARVQLNINKEFILIENNLVQIESISKERNVSPRIMATIAANLIHYGYVLSKEAFTALATLDEASVKQWWSRFEPSLKEITGDSKNMADYVVYKNFPQEVLDMSQAQYWISQIFMYWGAPNDWFTEDVKDRESLLENTELKVLHLVKEGSVQKVLDMMLQSPAKWTPRQFESSLYLVKNEELNVDVSKIPFKENMVMLVSAIFDEGIELNIKSATDVLRLAIGLSDGDVSLDTNSKFRKFNRSQRQQLLSMLEDSSNLAEDMMRYKGKWKKFMYSLHPGDYANKFPGVCEAYNALYNGKIVTFNGEVEMGLLSKSTVTLDLLKSRPGEFMRRLNKVVDVFGTPGTKAFIEIIGKLSIIQLLKIEKYIESVNVRKQRTIAPKGNWNKLQILEGGVKMPVRIKSLLLKSIREEIAGRMKELVGSVKLDERTSMIKLQTNGAELSPYGRGTSFPIPENAKFIRTASYWENKDNGNTWFDNGWNFFDENWKNLGTCAWNDNSFGNKAAVFSGDPTNSKEMKGKACQMIDLYIDQLADKGVRYAVWNILCYSHIKFKNATDVFAALQWGEEAQKGKLFEPSRCQMAFPLDGDSLTKYIAYIDVKERKLVYMDANLRGNTQSATFNGELLEGIMPAFSEYLDTVPSIYDLFKGVARKNGKTNVVYDDASVELTKDEKAYVFKPVTESNSFSQINTSELLNS
jgi:hypothetical protein